MADGAEPWSAGARGVHTVTRVVGPGGGWAARKALRPELGGREDLRARLIHEGRCLAVLGGSHHVLACHAVDEASPALLLEWAPGGSLAALLGAGPTPGVGRRLPAARVHRLAAELADALARVHARGWVHRDVKPSNVLLAADGSARLADFGVAARAGARGALGDDWDEEPAGTLGYAAPEQLAGQAAHPAADVYGLGALLYELVTGRLPWELGPGEDEAGLRGRVLAGAVVPNAMRYGVGEREAGVLARALEYEPGRRHGDVLGLLRDWLGGAGGAPGGP